MNTKASSMGIKLKSSQMRERLERWLVKTRFPAERIECSYFADDERINCIPDPLVGHKHYPTLLITSQTGQDTIWWLF